MPSGNARKRKAQKKSAAKNNQIKPLNTKAKEETSTNQITEEPTDQLFHCSDAANNIECEVNGTETIEKRLELYDTHQCVNGDITGKQQQQQQQQQIQ